MATHLLCRTKSYGHGKNRFLLPIATVRPRFCMCNLVNLRKCRCRIMQQDDLLMFRGLSRLGRSLMEVMSILHTLMEKEVKVFTTQERYELGNNISSKVLAFAFSLSAEIERSMISSRTKEALARKRSEGMRLGRPKGRLSSVTKLSGKEELIREYLEKKIPPSVIAPPL